ncbi:MAG TPA: hypothetical protein VMS94_07210 [Acidobacteriota bacterium]|nr:hypothetical protein [Acidobacteriota bacterium]
MAKEEQKGGSSSPLNLSSKFLRTFLIILAVFMIFLGPTYMVYALLKVLDLSYSISMASGFAIFIVGLVLLFYLIKKGVLK